MTASIVALDPAVGLTAGVCTALGVSRATVHRKRTRLLVPPKAVAVRPKPVRALTAGQQREVLDLLHSPRFADRVAKRTDAA